jgi:hypothetical protein
MSEIKKPQDHKSKADSDDGSRFSFTHNGKKYTFKPTAEILTPRYLRANRRRTPVDFEFTLFEELADEETLEAIDSMTRSQFNQLSRDFRDHYQAYSGVSAGESSAS